MPPQPIVEFYYDISCPFAYIASTRIEALATRTNARLLYRPVLLGAIYRAIAAPQGAAGSASDVYPTAKKSVTSASFHRTLQRFGIPYAEPPRHPVKTTKALRLLYSVPDGERRRRLTGRLFRAYWVQGRDVSSAATLGEIARESGDEGVVRLVEEGGYEGAEQRKELEKFTDLAVRRGAPGVPGFWLPQLKSVDLFGEEKVGRLFWGQDRMHFLEAALEGLNSVEGGKAIGELEGPILGLMPRCARGRGIPEGVEVKVQFWYDFSSPWAFLGWTQLARLKRLFGERLVVEMKPFLLGILFREIGTPNEPSKAASRQRAAYNSEDHRDWTHWWNAVNKQANSPDKNIDFYWADNFPIRTPTLLRVVLVEPELVEVLFRACWEQNLDMSSDSVLASVLSSAGYNAETLLAKANSPETKARLRACTKEAVETGLCGVPSYRVFRRRVGEGRPDGEEVWTGGEEVVWGQDEVNVVEDLVVGWEGRPDGRPDGEGVATVAEGKRGSKL